jgi:hypothetical protein
LVSGLGTNHETIGYDKTPAALGPSRHFAKKLLRLGQNQGYRRNTRQASHGLAELYHLHPASWVGASIYSSVAAELH